MKKEKFVTLSAIISFLLIILFLFLALPYYHNNRPYFLYYLSFAIPVTGIFIACLINIFKKSKK